MLINTPNFGPIEVQADTVIEFPAGLVGQPQLTRFKLLNEDKPQVAVYWLQSLDDVEQAFSLVEPSRYGVKYELLLTDEQAASLQASSPEQVLVFLSISRGVDGKTVDATPTLPFVLNPASRRGLQLANVSPEIVFRTA